MVHQLTTVLSTVPSSLSLSLITAAYHPLTSTLAPIYNCHPTPTLIPTGTPTLTLTPTFTSSRRSRRATQESVGTVDSREGSGAC